MVASQSTASVGRLSGQVGALVLGTDPHTLPFLQIGLLTTMAILLHEIPHEVSSRGARGHLWEPGAGAWGGAALQGKSWGQIWEAYSCSAPQAWGPSQGDVGWGASRRPLQGAPCVHLYLRHAEGLVPLGLRVT